MKATLLCYIFIYFLNFFSLELVAVYLEQIDKWCCLVFITLHRCSNDCQSTIITIILVESVDLFNDNLSCLCN